MGNLVQSSNGCDLTASSNEWTVLSRTFVTITAHPEYVAALRGKSSIRPYLLPCVRRRRRSLRTQVTYCIIQLNMIQRTDKSFVYYRFTFGEKHFGDKAKQSLYCLVHQ